MTRELSGNGYESRWKLMTVLEREEIVLWALKKTTEAVRDESEIRGECSGFPFPKLPSRGQLTPLGFF